MHARRILVLGSPGSGKSMLSRRLGEITGLPVVHLDGIYWKPGWVESTHAEFDARVVDAVAQDEWIIDGSYSRTLDLRLPRAELVIYLDFGRLRCVWNAYRRSRRYAGQTRPDMGAGCPEKFDLDFAKFIWDYPARSRAKVLSKLAAQADRIPITLLRSHAEVERYLETCSQQMPAARYNRGTHPQQPIY